MRGRLLLMALILCGVSAINCFPAHMADDDSSLGGDEQAVKRFDEHRAMWERTSSDNYIFTYNYNCFCSHGTSGSIRVFIRNDDSIGLIEYIDSGKRLQGPFEENEFFTIDGLFDQLRTAIAFADMYSVRYHSEFGYPLKVSVDRSFGFIDDEYRFEAYGYMPQ